MPTSLVREYQKIWRQNKTSSTSNKIPMDVSSLRFASSCLSTHTLPPSPPYKFLDTCLSSMGVCYSDRHRCCGVLQRQCSSCHRSGGLPIRLLLLQRLISRCEQLRLQRSAGTGLPTSRLVTSRWPPFCTPTIDCFSTPTVRCRCSRFTPCLTRRPARRR